MAKANIETPEGTKITIEGTPEEVAKIIQSTQGTQKIAIKPKIKETKRKKIRSSSKSPKKIEIEEYDLKKDEKRKSLKEFFEEKKPKDKHPEKIMVIGYYITKMLKKSEFTEGNIDFAILALKLGKRAPNLHQVMLDMKSKRQFLETGTKTNSWTLSRIGELFVEDHLPPQKNKK